MSNTQYSANISKIIDGLKKLRKAEKDSVIPFMNGDFTEWDLYLAVSCEYCMRLIDGMIPMLESRNFVCAAQLLRAQIGACMRTFALFVCDDVDLFLQTFFSNGRIDKLKDRKGKKLTDGRLKSLLCQFDPTIAESYDMASGLTHYSFEGLTRAAHDARVNNIPRWRQEIQYRRTYCPPLACHLLCKRKAFIEEE